MTDPRAEMIGLSMLSPEARTAMAGTMPMVTLRAARERLENATSPAEQTKLKQFVFQYELREEAAREQLFSQSHNQDVERATELALRRQELEAEVAEKAADVQSGRATPAELRQAVEDVDRVVREMREYAETQAGNYEHREALASADLADLQDDLLNRFPVLRERLPVLLGELPEPALKLHASYRRPANVNPSASIHGHADSLFRATGQAIRTLEEAEARAKALEGPKDSDLTDRFPALHGRSL